MKKIPFAIAILLTIVCCSSCWHHFGNYLEISSSGEIDGKPITSIRIRNNSDLKEIKYGGDIRLNENETGIEAMSPNALLAFRKNGTEMVAVADASGKISYQYDNGPKTNAPSEEGKRLLTEAIREMISNGFAAKERMTKIYNRGGLQALLEETEKLDRDDIKSTYFEFMMSRDSISARDLAAIARKISSTLGSDNDKENLLSKFNVERLKDPATSDAYLDAIGNLGSDYAKENLLSQMISRGAFPDSGSDKLLETIDHIGSDHAKENLLTQIMHKHDFAGTPFDKLLVAVDHLGSDNAKENLLALMINKDSIARPDYDELINTISHMGSDNAKENLYAKLIERKTNSERNFETLIEKINEMGSDNARQNLYEKFSNDPNLTENQWISLIEIAAKIGSDYNRSQFLITLAKKMPSTEKVKNAYLTVAKTIQPDDQYGRTIKAIQ